MAANRLLCRLFVLLCLLCAPSRGRADIPPELADEPIVEVQVAGETAAIALPREVGVPLGAPLNRALLRSTIQRLIASGRWTDVQIDAVPMSGGVRLIVWLTPRIVLHRLDITGNERLSEQAIRDALRLGGGSEITPAELEQLGRSVAKLYAERGYLGAQIGVDLRDTDDPSRKVLILEIAEGAPTRIARIHFRGEQPRDPGAVLLSMDSSVGDVFDRRALENDVAEAETFLRRHGYLEAELGMPLVTIRGTRASIEIPSRIGLKYRVLITGQEPFSRSEIAGVLELDRERLTPVHLDKIMPERVRDHLARHGYGSGEVELSLSPGPQKGSVTLRVRVQPGVQRRVVAISFAGARHFSRDFLRDQVYSYLTEELPGSALTAGVDSEVVDELVAGEPPGRAREVPPPPLTNPELFFYEPVYQKAIEHVVELYRGEGFLSVKVGPTHFQPIGKDRAAVLIPVSEGPRTLLHQVAVRGAAAISPRELLLAAGLERDQPFSYLALAQARRHMLDLYHERGYAFAEIDPRVRFSPDRTRASIDLQVVERYPVRVDRIVIEGAERTSHALIRRVLTIEPGDLYRPTEARDSERELGSLGVFTGVSVALQDPELPARVKAVLVTVSERPSQFLDFSAGLSTGQGARGGFEYGYRNLFGQAVSTTLRVQLAYQLFFVDRELEQRFDALAPQDQLERRVSLGTTIPRMPFLGPVRTSIDLVHLRDNERDFGLDQNAAGITFTHSPLRYVTLTLGGDLENNTVGLFVGAALQDYLRTVESARLRRLLRVPEGSSTLVAGRTSISYDRRDSAFTPTQGYFLSTHVELARTLRGEPDQFETVDEFVSRFVKLSLTLSGYVPIGEFVLAGQARAGRIVHLTSDSRTYPNRAFFLGGVDTMRGYLEDELIPQDIADAQALARDPNFNPNAIVRAGDAFTLLRAELRFPIYGELRGGVFSDLGNLWADAGSLDPLRVRPTAGAGLRLDTPVGPIALDWGFNLAQREQLQERSNAVHFSIGLF